MFAITMASSKVSPPTGSRFNSERPTNARKGVIIFAVTLAILAYIDRVCISQAMPLIRRDLGFDNTQVGMIFAAFGLAYAAFEVPGGWMGDWMGPRKVLMRIVIWWSLFTAFTGAAWSFFSLWFTRFLFGAGEAGCFPNLTKAFSVWLPQQERVRAQGIMWTFARWGGAFTPPLVILVLSYISWRWAFVLFGGLGVIWAVWFYKWFRDNPKDHPSVNAAEWKLLEGLAENAESHGDVNPSTLRKVGTAVILIVGTLAATSLLYPQQYSYIFVGMVLVGGTAAHLWGRKHRGTIWGEMLCSRSVWLLWVQYFLLSFPWYFYITWLPSYLKDQRPFSPLMQSAGASLGIDWLQASSNTANLAILPLFFGGCGSLVCGLLSARVARWTGSVKTTRRLMASLGFFGAGSMLLLSIKIQDPLPAMIMMGFASFFNDLVMPGAWAACMDIGGRYAGTLAGSMNMMGNVAGFVAPMVGGRILDSTKQATGTADYNPFLYVMAVVYLLGTVVWPFIDPITSIDHRESH